MKIVSVVGARPQFVKLAAISRELDKSELGIVHTIVHTGQHYDKVLSDNFFNEFEIPTPILNLRVGSGTHAEQTASILVPLEKFLYEELPDLVITYGDTNSAFGAAIVAAKMKIPLAHLEAGLRSKNKSMPEELNRITIDHLSNINLAPTFNSLINLKNEGLSETSLLVGDVMVDVFNRTQFTPIAKLPIAENFRNGEDFFLATLHREELTSSKEKLVSLFEALTKLRNPVVLPIHPRLEKQLSKFGLNDLSGNNLKIIPPLSHQEILGVMSRSTGVLTDSGGLQKEAYLLKKPCVTLRSETEWVETLVGGWNVLIWENFEALENFPQSPLESLHNPLAFGDGYAARRIVEALTS